MAVRYSPEIAERICQRLALGESLLAICRADDMPEESAVRQWVAADRDGFAARYAQARAIGYERMADEILALSDATTIRKKTLPDGTQLEEEDVGAVQRNRLQVDSRKWLLSKMLPKTFGDRVQVEHSGQVGPALSTDELMAIAARGTLTRLIEGADGVHEPDTD